MWKNNNKILMCLLPLFNPNVHLYSTWNKNLHFPQLSLTGSYLNGNKHKLRLFRFLNRFLFSEEKKLIVAKNI